MDNVTHFEIPIEKPERASDFYKQIFGWNIIKLEGPMPYWIVRTVEIDESYMPKKLGVINGGFTTKDDLETPTIVITVDNIDERLKKIKEHKAEIITEKRIVGNMGWYARFKDTEGNIIGIWEDIKR